MIQRIIMFQILINGLIHWLTDWIILTARQLVQGYFITSTNAPGQSGPGTNVNEGVLEPHHLMQFSVISSSPYLVGSLTLLVGGYSQFILNP